MINVKWRSQDYGESKFPFAVLTLVVKDRYPFPSFANDRIVLKSLPTMQQLKTNPCFLS